MDPELLAASKVTEKKARQMQFAPKAPPRRARKLVLPKSEKQEDDFDVVKSEELLRRFNESTIRTAKVEKKGSIHFAGAGEGFLKSFKSNLHPKGATNLQSSASNIGSASIQPEKEYIEPWDYYTYYPTTLPLRRPYSGNPEVLNEKEFGKTLQHSIYNESSRNSAGELGLFEEALEDNLFFLQLPLHFPKGNEASANNNLKAPSKAMLCKLNELGGGLLGKMLVYKSGAVKMKLGETLYDVSPSMDCVFAQDVAAINTEEKTLCNLGELNKRATLTPDIDSVLETMHVS